MKSYVRNTIKLSCAKIFLTSVIGRLVGVLGVSGFLHCLVGWLGVTAVRCYDRAFFLRCIRRPLQVYCCGGEVLLWCWYVRRASGFRGVIGLSITERNDYDKTRRRGRKKNFKCYTYMYACAYIYICVVVMRPMYLHLM